MSFSGDAYLDENETLCLALLLEEVPSPNLSTICWEIGCNGARAVEDWRRVSRGLSARLRKGILNALIVVISIRAHCRTTLKPSDELYHIMNARLETHERNLVVPPALVLAKWRGVQRVSLGLVRYDQ